MTAGRSSEPTHDRVPTCPRTVPRARRTRVASLFLGLRFRFLAHDDDLLTVHLDGAPVGRRLALGLRSAALAPLAKLLLQVLEHPAPPADPPSVAGRPARGPVGSRLRYCR